MLAGDIMMDHWHDIEAVLLKYKVSEADFNKALKSYRGLCEHYNDSEAEARMLKNLILATKLTDQKDADELYDGIKNSNSIERYRREQWPYEWSDSDMSD